MLKRTTGAVLVSSAMLMVPFAAMSQTSSDGATSATTSEASATNNEQTRLISQYTQLAGSLQNSTSLVEGLRSGTQVTLTAEGKTTTFTPPTGTMGYGEVNLSLALAESLMASNSSLTLSSALMGSGSTQGILQMRASGMGWGQIADSLGVKLGDVVRSARADRAKDIAERSEHADRLERPEHPMRIERPERPERVERGR